MNLPKEDVDFLGAAGLTYRVFDDGMLNVELLDFELPPGLNAPRANILFRLSPNYPDTPPDMWWAVPHLTTASGGAIAATESVELYDGRNWQRWSRHLEVGIWNSGIDGLESYVRLLRTELEKAATA